MFVFENITMANSNAQSNVNASIFNAFNDAYNSTKITKRQIYSKVDQIKKIRDDFEKMFLVDTAQFFTDKLITLEHNDDHDNDADSEIYRMAKLLHQKEQYHRAALMIISNNFHLKNLSARYLAAKCYVCHLFVIYQITNCIIFFSFHPFYYFLV